MVLVAPDVVLTAAHCVEKGLRYAVGFDKRRIFFDKTYDVCFTYSFGRAQLQISNVARPHGPERPGSVQCSQVGWGPIATTVT